MKDLKIIRKNIVANEANKFEFDTEGFEFVVKNFGDADIFVGFKNTTETDDMIKIPAMSGQVCIRNKSTGSTGTGNSSKDVYVYGTSAGEVEIQCLKF